MLFWDVFAGEVATAISQSNAGCDWKTGLVLPTGPCDGSVEVVLGEFGVWLTMRLGTEFVDIFRFVKGPVPISPGSC